MKNKINYKLVNLALISLVIFLLYRTGHLWTGVISKFFQIMMPFIIAFVIAYALYPFLKQLESKKIPKGVAIFIIIALILGILSFTVFKVVPLLFNQTVNLFNSAISFVKEMSLEYDYDLGPLQDTLTNGLNDVVVNVGKYVSNGAINIINVSLGLITNIFLCFTAAIYFLIDMDSIRRETKKYLKRRSYKTFRYVRTLDGEMKNYLSGFVKLMFISFFEYSIIYKLIGHPNALLLGFLAMITQLIPYFGGIITNIVAAVTAIVVSPVLLVKTVITFCILSVIDGNIIGPLVYGKTNNVKPVVVIISITAGGILFGITGIVASFPVAIILIATYKFYKEEIFEKLGDMKDSKKK
mgnify:CR=1 FL=1